jgi:hypothetical protein
MRHELTTRNRSMAGVVYVLTDVDTLGDWVLYR